jgi:hypothetical protein
MAKHTVLYSDILELNPQHFRGVQIFPDRELWSKKGFAVPYRQR